MGKKNKDNWGISDQSNQTGEKTKRTGGLAINQIKWGVTGEDNWGISNQSNQIGEKTRRTGRISDQ